MNCPGHILIYKAKLHSRDSRALAELGAVYRYERGGVLLASPRPRLHQDDAHISARPIKSNRSRSLRRFRFSS
jgi:threonyl-tRNA synthetase